MVSQSNVYLGMMDPIAYCFRNTTAVTTSGFLKWVAIHEIMNRQVRRWSIPLAGSAKTRTIFWQNHRFYEYNIIYIYIFICVCSSDTVVLHAWFYMDLLKLHIFLHGLSWFIYGTLCRSRDVWTRSGLKFPWFPCQQLLASEIWKSVTRNPRGANTQMWWKNCLGWRLRKHLERHHLGKGPPSDRLLWSNYSNDIW